MKQMPPNYYLQKYRELELIGRGNFGSATLIQLNSDPRQHYIAKKIQLESLKEREQQSALLEAEVLKDLKHPNIVSYIESFIDNGVLVIIMEYCEEGDLSYHVKRKKAKNEFLPEKLILNWFLQLLLALKAIHEKKILHRDIKTSNIFVTSNGTVKIGDFGISKILENTQDQAQTVVGTPYYMSPEVCESKPYTYKSDIWALGCVLYELCTLKHAFDSNSLLGLVYKIVQEKVDSIPNHYSSELQSICQRLLTKQEPKRPSILEIFNDQFIQKTMQEFITQKGIIQETSRLQIKGTKTHGEVRKIMDRSNRKQSITQQPNNNIQTKTRPFDNDKDGMDDTIMSSHEQTMNNNNRQQDNYNEDYDKTLQSQYDKTMQQSQHDKTFQSQYDKTLMSQYDKTMQSQYDKTMQSQYEKTMQTQQFQKQSERSMLGDTVYSQQQQSNMYGNKEKQMMGDTVYSMQQTQNNQEENPYQNIDISQLTPQQKIQLRKDQEAWKKQQELKNAIKDNQSVNYMAKQRKNDQFLQTHQIDRGIQQQQKQMYQSQANQQYKNIQQSQYQEFKQLKQQQQQQMQKQQQQYGMDDTVYSVNEQTISPVNYNKTFNISSYSEDRPLNNKNYLSQMNSQVQNMDLNDNDNDSYENNNNNGANTFEKTQFNENTQDIREITAFQQIPVQDNIDKNQDSGGDDYDDDFEEYFDSDEDQVQEDTRLTKKANDQDLQNVIDLYKNQLSGNNNNYKAALNTVTPLEDIKETTLEYKPMTPQQPKVRRDSIQLKQERTQRYKDEIISKIGAEQFYKLYSFLKIERQKDTPDDLIRSQVQEQFGKKMDKVVFQMDQLIFLESRN